MLKEEDTTVFSVSSQPSKSYEFFMKTTFKPTVQSL